MTPLRILLTNHTLADRGGSDLFVRDVATALLERGHRPVVYSPVRGAVAEDLRIATVPVVDDLHALAERPDLIHGQHHLETMTALLHFPGVPSIFYCHGWMPWEEAPPRFPRILRYLAVDEVCRDRLVCEHGIRDEEVTVLLNFVDLGRFVRRPPLPVRPRRALLFCNEDGPHVAAVREACRRVDVAVDVIGRAFGNATSEPQALLPHYDVVFAKARSALEGMAAGTAVVLVSGLGVGPMVTMRDFERLRALNFGIRTLRGAITPERLTGELARYNAMDAAAVSDRVWASAGREEAVNTLIDLYQEVLAEYRASTEVPDAAAESRAAARYLRSLSAPFKWVLFERASLQRRVDHAEAEVTALRETLSTRRS